VRLRRSAPAWLILLIVVVLIAVQYFGGEQGDAPPVDVGDTERTYVVERVIDGDTLLIAGGERLRLLGVDTPETVHPSGPVERLGPEASLFTKRLVEGKSVRLGFDKERKDRYGRLLVYVYVDGRLLNEELIRAGLGEAQLQYPYSNAMKRRFQQAEEEARQARRGLWALPVEATQRRAA
jgi:micrococcal nuclease